MSILDPSYMIDLGGIDVIQSQGVAIPGLYQKLLDNIGPCGNPLIYNWKFNGVFIPPQYVEPILEDDTIYINDIYVSSDDVVHIPSIEIPPTIVQLNVSENGEYEVPEGVDGYNPVSVDVHPVIQSITITENGTYSVPSGVDGYGPVIVNVAGEEYIYDFGLVEGYTPVNIFNGSQTSDVSYNTDGTAHILGTVGNRRFLGFAVDLTGVSSIEFLCSFKSGNNTIGVIASQTVDDIMNNRGGAITIYPAYAAFPPVGRVCIMSLDTSSLSGQYYVGILGYEESWSSDLAQMWINRSVE